MPSPNPAVAVRGTAPRASLFGLAALCLPLSVAAQSPSDTVPAGYVNRAGNSRHWIPGHFAPARAQTTYDASVVTLPTGNLTALWLRPDEDPASGAMQAHQVELTIHLGSQDLPAPTHLLPTSYSANHGLDHTLVLDRTSVSFPAFTPSAGISPWNVAIPIQPFPFVAGRALQIEWDVLAGANGPSSQPWFTDAQDFTKREGGGWFRRTQERDACPAQGTIYDGDVGGPGELASIWFYSLANAGLPAVTWFGFDDQDFAGQPLPIHLGAYGHPGCALRVDLALPLSGVTDAHGALGRFRVDVRVPFDTQLAGFEMFTQTFVFDPSFNGGLRVSDKGELHIGNFVGRVEARHLYSYHGAISDRPEFAVDRAPILGLR